MLIILGILVFFQCLIGVLLNGASKAPLSMMLLSSMMYAFYDAKKVLIFLLLRILSGIIYLSPKAILFYGESLEAFP